MADPAPQDAPTHAELAAAIPAPPPDEENDAIIFARKTMLWTTVLTVGFVGAAVIWTFLLER